MPDSLPLGVGWNVKPAAILATMQSFGGRVVWLDSDLVFERGARRLDECLESPSLIVAEEATEGGHFDGEALRAKRWGLPVGRSLPHTINTCIVGATLDHVPLLKEWRRMLQLGSYIESQSLPWEQRPTHMVGDQDVLSALLCSRDFASTSLSIISVGDVIQYHGVRGYSPQARLSHMTGKGPIAIHSQGHKPWADDLPAGAGLRSWLSSISADLSPYKTAAYPYAKSEFGDGGWAQPKTPLGKLLSLNGALPYPLAGLPLAILVATAVFIRAMLQRPFLFKR